MRSCEIKFGSQLCRKRSKRKQCLDSCEFLKSLNDSQLIQVLIDYSLCIDERSYSQNELIIVKAKNGDKDAVNQIIKQIKPMSDWIVEVAVNKIGNPRLALFTEDLQSEVLYAIPTAIDLYDPKKSNFNTYAFWQIRGSLSNILRKELETDKRRINYLSGMLSFQDKATKSIDENDQEMILEDTEGKNDLDFNKIEIDEFKNDLAADEREVLDLILEGYQSREIYKVIGSIIESQEIVASIKIKIKEFFSIDIVGAR